MQNQLVHAVLKCTSLGTVELWQVGFVFTAKRLNYRLQTRNEQQRESRAKIEVNAASPFFERALDRRE